MNKVLQIGSFALCCLFSALTSTAQEQTPQIRQMLEQRTVLAASGQSYAELEKEIVALGQLPPALVVKSVNAGKATFDFTTYKDIRTESEARVAERIRVSIPQVESVVISNRRIVIVFTAAATEADIAAFFKLMGYESYEIKAN